MNLLFGNPEYGPLTIVVSYLELAPLLHDVSRVCTAFNKASWSSLKIRDEVEWNSNVVKIGPERERMKNSKRRRYWTLSMLYYAVVRGRNDIVEHLLSKLPSETKGNDYFKGRIDSIKLPYNVFAQWGARDPGFVLVSPLFVACSEGNISLVKLLLEKFGGTVTRYGGSRELILFGKRKKVVRKRSNKAKSWVEEGHSVYTPLYEAANKGHLEVVKELVENCEKFRVGRRKIADKEQREKRKRGSEVDEEVHAMFLKRCEFVKCGVLMQRVEVDLDDLIPFAKWSKKQTPKKIADENGHVEIVEYLKKFNSTNVKKKKKGRKKKKKASTSCAQ